MIEKVQTHLKENYLKSEYDNLPRFISYFYQIDLIRELQPKKVLEIGIGNKTVSTYLKERHYEITTCDLDVDLEPDYVADIRKLPFQNNTFDVVMVCQILEHIPYESVSGALSELFRVSRKNVIISLPYNSTYFEVVFKFPYIRKLINKEFIDLFMRIPLSFMKIGSSGNHHWEIARRGYPLRKVRKTIREKFKILKEFRPPLNGYHHFFVLEKKQNLN